jgi:hypothetical protein
MTLSATMLDVKPCAGRRRLRCGLLAATVLVAGCEGLSPTDPTLVGAGGSLTAEVQRCADEINRHRASIGLDPLARVDALEEFAARAAENDGRAHAAHQYFAHTNGGGISGAETEILWWKGFSVRGVIERGIAQMWDVGPGGEHYHILAGPYVAVGCGVYVSGGEVTVTQEFR